VSSYRPQDAAHAIATHAPSIPHLFQGNRALLEAALAAPLERVETYADLTQRVTSRLSFVERDDVVSLKRELRKERHAAVARIAAREILRVAEVEETSAELATLADVLVEAALRTHRAWLEDRHGEVKTPDGERVPFVVLGMGKLGGEELNFGSDIDVCFFYETDDAESAKTGKSAHEVFAQLSREVSSTLSDVTDEGFCFRVDLRLRPEGTRGAIANSLASAERYYETFGRPWERAALLRARAIAGDLALGEELLRTLRPFVFPRRVETGIANDMQQMLVRSRKESGALSHDDIKLGLGGIRELEFFVQAQQLIWGGQHAELRVRSTLLALARLEALGFVRANEARELVEAWSLLRRVEHRIHMSTGYQTHALPRDEEALARLAESLGFASGDSLSVSLGAARARVHASFVTLLDDSPTGRDPRLDELCELLATLAPASTIAEQLPDDLGFADIDEAATHLVRLAKRPGSPLHPASRAKHPELGPVLLREVLLAVDPLRALANLSDFFARIGGSWAYDRLLVDEPRLGRRLISLFGTSSALSSLLIGHPEGLDALLRIGEPMSEREIAETHEALTELDDDESLVAALRRIKREITLRAGLALVAREIDARRAEALLSALADAQILAAAAFAKRRFALTSPLSIVGLGKLGGREIGFGSDLDLFFLHDAENASPEEEAAVRAAQRVLRILCDPHAEGPGYAIDMRLRPSGSKGLLVVSRESFRRYHATQAAEWERLALVRARTLGKDAALDSLLRAVTFVGPADREGIAALRGRIERELGQGPPRTFHPKFGRGGLLDVEFTVQVLELDRTGSDERSTNTIDMIAGLERRGALARQDAQVLAEGWRFMRDVEQGLKLAERGERVRFDGTTLDVLARHLRITDRDGDSAAEVVEALLRRHASSVRERFEALIAPIYPDAV
jgi:glutamate-ammonia-ligase adenylyltransferase